MSQGNDSGYPNVCRNWMAIPHQRLYEDIRTGPGVEGTRPTQDTYERIAELFARVDEQIQVGLARIGVAYEGAGSEAAQSGITVLQQWTRDAQYGSRRAGELVAEQAQDYATARDAMPEPVRVTAQDGFFEDVYDFFGGTTAREEQEEQAREAHLRAAQVMSDYDLLSAQAANSMPVFVPPPAVTVEVAPPDGQPGGGSTSTSGGGYSGGRSGGSAQPVPAGSSGPTFTAPVSTPSAPDGVPAPTAPSWSGGPPPGPGPIGPTGPGQGTPPGPGGSTPHPAGTYPVPPGGYRAGAPGTGAPATGAPRSGSPGSGGPGSARTGVPPAAGFRPGDQEHAGRRGINAGGFGQGVLGQGGASADGPRTRGAGTLGAGFMQPAAPGGRSADDDEHRRRYVMDTDEYFADDRLVPPPVIGENDQR